MELKVTTSPQIFDALPCRADARVKEQSMKCEQSEANYSHKSFTSSLYI